jgi:hypothetical protein
MDEQTSTGPTTPDTNTTPLPTGATVLDTSGATSTDTTSTQAASTATTTPHDTSTVTDGTMTASSGLIVDKTLAEIQDGVVKSVETDVKVAEGEVVGKVRHRAHDILDELEAHLSQFDARAVAIYHGFLNRLRNAL